MPLSAPRDRQREHQSNLQHQSEGADYRPEMDEPGDLVVFPDRIEEEEPHAKKRQRPCCAAYPAPLPPDAVELGQQEDLQEAEDEDDGGDEDDEEKHSGHGLHSGASTGESAFSPFLAMVLVCTQAARERRWSCLLYLAGSPGLPAVPL